jgi:hypothetical protein
MYLFIEFSLLSANVFMDRQKGIDHSAKLMILGCQFAN